MGSPHSRHSDSDEGEGSALAREERRTEGRHDSPDEDDEDDGYEVG